MPAPSRSTTLHALYCDHHGWLHGWLRKRLGNDCEAADVAHDTFLRVYAGPRALDHLSEPRAFLTHVAKGLVVDLYRRRAVEKAYLDSLAQLPEALAPSPETRALVLEALHRIDAMLCAMPVRAREIFLLSQLDGLTYAEIAARQGISLRTVKRQMRDAFLACLSAI
ncbi:sigma-70 family RNA polymerase sigma factor [Cupriavidus cauae]|jgi:RNA polymerase sigma-70 factor (ECF subfamily)|uniref:Sigma-70 family RNA polymerase sigma factor n=1 Tax=Cupriavidus cauae TaxID=2608999 RepID=A0A5M8AJJ8_9BURK|nr:MULTISPECIES: sigma-70 family RNA polymerase sigma factor [Cupriavidus]KAA0182607.1 sigma-70 family RNA polymerase sigma factor [Cupriavidus gilardii]KAA6120974.1 sigma-70 family RNA polymerase sigma factor [Cupriavidus cauae]MCA7082574.1 sigma-70 family RNA polymerase sigma factor [Cupriavidus sp. DB3]UZN51402.1 sigma-70 family RNA polymerase sigma factor [Cupriavidus cauae]